MLESPMPTGYAPSSVPVTGAPGLPTAVVFVLQPAGSDGQPIDPQFWDHAGQVWETVFDAAVHARTCKPLGLPGTPLDGYCSYCFPSQLAHTRSVKALILRGDGKGGWVPLDSYGAAMCEVYSDLQQP